MSPRMTPPIARRCEAAVRARVAALQAAWPGVVVDERHGMIHLSIPEKFRVGHEAHFAEVTRNFLGYLRNRGTLPAWERPNMLAKYYVTTTGTEMSHKAPIKVAEAHRALTAAGGPRCSERERAESRPAPLSSRCPRRVVSCFSHLQLSTYRRGCWARRGLSHSLQGGPPPVSIRTSSLCLHATPQSRWHSV